MFPSTGYPQNGECFPQRHGSFFVVKVLPISGVARRLPLPVASICHRWLPSEKGFDGDHRPIIVLSRKKIRNGNLVGGFNPSEKYESQLG
jgi:hypothetical protein